MAQRGDGVDSRRTDTRERAIGVALGLFAQQGYAGTSLREIAEQLGVTKAALYFHFHSKEEILTAILRGYLDGINALLADTTQATHPGQPTPAEPTKQAGQNEPATRFRHDEPARRSMETERGEPAKRAEREALLRGFAEHQRRWGLDLVLMVRQNFTEIQQMPIGAEIRKSMRTLVDALAPPEADAAQRLRVRIALSAFQTAAVTGFTEDTADEAALREAALTIALEILHSEPPDTGHP